MEHITQLAVIISIALIQFGVGLAAQALPVSLLLSRSFMQQVPMPAWAKWLILSTLVGLTWPLACGLLISLISGQGAF